ncbi:30S ribosomal protein S16 [Candidatus Giovannonibacteria bacterium]|nr:30S ribosomal protein S16 [Candidatus Giovannonibacteria bacterium]
MLMVRLQRVGRKNDPSFRVVITDSRNSTKSGKFLEIVGSYDARKGEPRLKAERIQYWLSKGAKTSDTVHNLLVQSGLMAGAKIDVSQKPKKEAEKKTEPAPAAPA